MAILVTFNLTCLSVETFQSVFDRSRSRSLSGIRLPYDHDHDIGGKTLAEPKKPQFPPNEPK
jgi:hypothetical protein